MRGIKLWRGDRTGFRLKRETKDPKNDLKSQLGGAMKRLDIEETEMSQPLTS